jgi:hypothetical protein
MFIFSIVMYKNVYASQMMRAQCTRKFDRCPSKPIAAQSVHEIDLD